MNKLVDYLIKEKNIFINKLDDAYYDGKVVFIDNFTNNFTQYSSYDRAKTYIDNIYKLCVKEFSTEASEQLQSYWQGAIDLIEELRNKFVELRK